MLNSVCLMGRLTADPELKSTQSGVSVCSFRIAVDRTYQPKGQEKQTDFINIVTWRGTAEFVSRYFRKGQLVAVQGSIQTGQYTDRDGNKIVMLDVINSETPDFAEQLHLAIESEKMLHAVQERLSKREQIVVIFRYGLWGQEELTQQEIAGRLGISRSYVYRHIYCK